MAQPVGRADEDGCRGSPEDEFEDEVTLLRRRVELGERPDPNREPADHPDRVRVPDRARNDHVLLRAGAAADEATEHEGETVEASEEEVESEDPDLEPGEELEEEDFASDVDPMLEAAVRRS